MRPFHERAWALAIGLVLAAASPGCALDTRAFVGPDFDAASLDGGRPDGGPRVDACVPRTCAEAAAACGRIDDGCGGTRNCGDCGGGETCSAAHACEPCVPRTCTDVAAVCGVHPDGCGGMTESCGECAPTEACSAAGACGDCAPDAAEPNDEVLAAHLLSDITDEPDTAPESFTDFTFHTSTDTDWYVFRLVDGPDTLGPDMTVSLRGLSPGTDAELYVMVLCPSGETAVRTCLAGNYIRETIPGGSAPGCSSTNATGADETVRMTPYCAGGDIDVYVRIEVYGEMWTSCAPYELVREAH